MIESTLVLLHVAHGQEMTLLASLFYVLAYLLAIGGIAVLVFWFLTTVETVRVAYSDKRGRKESDR